MMIAFGALAPKLHEQITVSRRKLSYLQTCADGLTHLSIGGLLTDAETHRARRRLLQRIMRTFPQARNRTATSRWREAAKQ